MKTKKRLSALLLLFIVLFSCKKDDNNTTGKKVSATVIYTGELSLDGCGWLVKIDSTNVTYSPVTLSDTYKKNNLPVVISYNLLTSKYHCGMLAGGSGITQIKITAIKNR